MGYRRIRKGGSRVLIELTEKQKEGLKIAVTRYNQNKKFTIISGYA